MTIVDMGMSLFVIYTGDVYGSSLCRPMTKRVASLQHILSFIFDSFTPSAAVLFINCPLWELS